MNMRNTVYPIPNYIRSHLQYCRKKRDMDTTAAFLKPAISSLIQLYSGAVSRYKGPQGLNPLWCLCCVGSFLAFNGMWLISRTPPVQHCFLGVGMAISQANQREKTSGRSDSNGRPLAPQAILGDIDKRLKYHVNQLQSLI